MSDQVLKQTLTIKVGDDEFVLRVPTPMERARIGVREAGIRRSLDPSGGGFGFVDDDTFCLIRGLAVLETLLEKASVKWVWAEDTASVLHVDIEKLPPGKEAEIAEVGRQFQDALDRFHRDGAGHPQSAVSEAVAGGVNTGAL